MIRIARRDLGAPRVRAGTRSRLRAVVAAVLVVLACALAPVAAGWAWVHDVMLDPDRYVAAVQPVAGNAAVQDAIAADVTRAVLDRLDQQHLTDEVYRALGASGGLPDGLDALLPAEADVDATVRRLVEVPARAAVGTAAFAGIWQVANRTAHQAVVTAATGRRTGAFASEDGRLVLDLTPMVPSVLQRLRADGLPVAGLSGDEVSVTVYRSATITRFQRRFRTLDAIGSRLPAVCLVLLGLGVLTARDRRRALARAALAVGAVSAASAIISYAVRGAVLSAVPTGAVQQHLAAALYDDLVGYLRIPVVVGLGVGVAGALGLLRLRSIRTPGPDDATEDPPGVSRGASA